LRGKGGPGKEAGWTLDKRLAPAKDELVVVSGYGGARGEPQDRSDSNRGACPRSGSGLKPFSRIGRGRAAQLEAKAGSIVNKAIQVQLVVNHDVRGAVRVPVDQEVLEGRSHLEAVSAGGRWNDELLDR